MLHPKKKTHQSAASCSAQTFSLNEVKSNSGRMPIRTGNNRTRGALVFKLKEPAECEEKVCSKRKRNWKLLHTLGRN